MDLQYFSGKEGVNKQRSISAVNGLTIFQWGGGLTKQSPKVLEMDLQYFTGG